jgi:hypothetical protein
VAASGHEVVVATAAGDLWLMPSPASSNRRDVSSSGRNHGAQGSDGLSLDDSIHISAVQPISIVEEGEAKVEGARAVSPTPTLGLVAEPPSTTASPRALIRGQTSSAQFVAWHPRREGVFAVAAGAARVILRDAATRTSLGLVWMMDPAPGRVVPTPNIIH